MARRHRLSHWKWLHGANGRVCNSRSLWDSHHSPKHLQSLLLSAAVSSRHGLTVWFSSRASVLCQGTPEPCQSLWWRQEGKQSPWIREINGLLCGHTDRDPTATTMTESCFKNKQCDRDTEQIRDQSPVRRKQVRIKRLLWPVVEGDSGERGTRKKNPLRCVGNSISLWGAMEAQEALFTSVLFICRNNDGQLRHDIASQHSISSDFCSKGKSCFSNAATT